MTLRGEFDVWAKSQSLSLRYRAASSLYTREPFLYGHKLVSIRCGPMTSIGPYRTGVESFQPRRGQSEKK